MPEGGILDSGTDVPVVRRSEDRLGRAEFAERFARQLELIPADHSLVAALVGPWGAGKTSVLNMVAECFEAVTDGENGEPPRRPIVMRFNPWLFSGTEQLLAVFFDAMADAMPDELGEGRGGSIATALRDYGESFSALKSLPFIGAALGAGGEVTSGLGSLVDLAMGSARELPDRRERLRQLERSPRLLTVQAAAFCSASPASSQVCLTSDGVL